MWYQVELAVCYEDETWSLENIRVWVDGIVRIPKLEEAIIWYHATEAYFETAPSPNKIIVAIGLYHYMAEGSDE